MNKPMHTADMEFLDRASRELNTMWPSKFQEGAETHYRNGPLIDNPLLLTHADEEVLDQWSYLRAIRYRHQEIVRKLAELARDNPKLSSDINDIVALIPQ